jgi:C1A family cysteine protease
MRTAGLTTKVQNQGSNGTCWSFAAMASLESTLVSKVPDIDLSEWSMAFYAFSPVLGYESGAKVPFRTGGGVNVAAPMLTNWYAPVPQADFPDSDLTNKNLDLTAGDLQERVVCHVSDVDIFLNDQDSDVTEDTIRAVKEKVLSGNAVSVIYYNSTAGLSTEHHSFYNPDFKPSEAQASVYHAVTIVGWDDDFSAMKFRNSPPRNGAFLCKNSWGPKNGENGYFWLSYAEPSISELYSVSSEPVQKHSGQYRYDTYGFCRGMAINYEDTTAYMANVFTAEEDTVVTSVMFVTAVPGDNYSVRVYQDLTDPEDPVSGKEVSTVNGYAPYAGYHTVDLETPVFLRAGETFSVAAKLSGGLGKHIPCEAYALFTSVAPDGTVTVDNETIFPEDLIVRDFHAGESFVSSDGLQWKDMYSYDSIDVDLSASITGAVKHLYGKVGNVCIRALTQDIGRVQFSEYTEEVPEGTAITLSCPGASEIRYSTDGNEYLLYDDPVRISGETTLSAYAVVNGKQYPVYTQHYKTAVAQISSILRTDTKEYLELKRIADDCWTAVCTRGSSDPYILPVTTGKIFSKSVEFGSYTQVRIQTQYALTLRTTEPGKRDGTYVLYLTDQIQGNVNLDGAVNASDAADVLLYAAKSGAGVQDTTKDAAWLDRADCNHDQLINAEDAAWILRYAAARGVGLEGIS